MLGTKCSVKNSIVRRLVRDEPHVALAQQDRQHQTGDHQLRIWIISTMTGWQLWKYCRDRKIADATYLSSTIEWHQSAWRVLSTRRVEIYTNHIGKLCVTYGYHLTFYV